MIPSRCFQVVIWTNTHGKARVFATTLGHFNSTMVDPVYLDLVARGLLWSVGQLDDKGNAKPGYGPGASNPSLSFHRPHPVSATPANPSTHGSHLLPHSS